ncbi:hypothetical protein [Glaciihabitans sp. UYNi722]|uniref:hypothetical protein n=1 Tax=Glaciihabitans sp. UYNi722 TaxID=3156344 RepID=UPI003399CEDD
MSSGPVIIQRVDKRAFEKAFKNGERVAIVKDPHYWKFPWNNEIGSTHQVPGPVGFTNKNLSLEDIYSDGPSRRGEAFRYWLVTTAEDPE